jgi:DNA polymerase-3 subunit gamma/tau
MRTYTPLALKYRPRKFADLVGQEVLKRTMSNAIKANRIYNAIFLVGPHGLGKTTSARIIAACLNSPGGETVTPKDCPEVDAIFEGKSPDVIELNAASNKGIDDIREIQKEIQYHPVNAKYKVYIIDEVHGLTPQAFEALLKTLEEPPPHCKFILCTTESHKLKGTTLSRCMEFNVSTLPWNQIAAHLKEVAQKEGVQIEDAALKVLAKRADGHMRDALKHLDATIMYAGVGEPITAEVARTAVGGADESLYFDLIDSVLNRKLATGLLAIQKVLGGGQTAGAVLQGMLDHLRTLFVIGACEDTAGIVSLTQEEQAKFLHQRGLMKLDLIDDMISNLVSIHRGLQYSVSPQVLFEQFLIKSIKTHYRLSQSAK